MGRRSRSTPSERPDYSALLRVGTQARRSILERTRTIVANNETALALLRTRERGQAESSPKKRERGGTAPPAPQSADWQLRIMRNP